MDNKVKELFGEVDDGKKKGSKTQNFTTQTPEIQLYIMDFLKLFPRV